MGKYKGISESYVSRQFNLDAKISFVFSLLSQNSVNFELFPLKPKARHLSPDYQTKEKNFHFLPTFLQKKNNHKKKEGFCL